MRRSRQKTVLESQDTVQSVPQRARRVPDQKGEAEVSSRRLISCTALNSPPLCRPVATRWVLQGGENDFSSATYGE